jgi:outer membrane protein TolC
MRNPKITSTVVWTLLSLLIAGCTVHPVGEHEEREAAQAVGKPFEKPVEDRQFPQLPDNPSTDQLVQYALLANAELEQRYWEWRAAIEQIPQDGTQTSTPNIAAGTTITRGQDSLSASTLALSNDPMTDIKWPSKLDAAAQQALENARAAGRRFRKAQFELRAKVLDAQYDYALNAELIRLEQSDHQLLETILSVTQSRSGAGLANQQDILKVANELDLTANDIANMESQLPGQRAALNVLLGRAPETSLNPPTQLPQAVSIRYSDDQLLGLATKQNPELQALADQISAQKQGIRLAHLQYIPDFNLSVGTDLMGISQSLLGQATIPIFRYEAIEAAVRQAQANLNATEAMRRQAGNDLSAQIVGDIATFRDARRQLDLISTSILPRVQRMIDVVQTEYESGQASLLDLLDARRTLIEMERLEANLRVTQAKRLDDVEAITCARL